MYIIDNYEKLIVAISVNLFGISYIKAIALLISCILIALIFLLNRLGSLKIYDKEVDKEYGGTLEEIIRFKLT